ncbi:MAG: TonB-dependent receptor [Bacteroidales bacterium]
MSRSFVFSFIFFHTIALSAQLRLDSTQLIPEVLVTAERQREMLVPQRLSGKLLEGLSTQSVADAIRYFSGVQLKDYGGVGGVKTVNIRSMGSHHVGVFYDGLQLGNAQNGQIDLGRYSLDNMEEIALYAGQKSELLQSARDFGTSGSIYLRSRRPRFEADKSYNLTTTFRTGSFGLANPSVLWEQKLSPRVSLSLNTEYIFATGKYRYRYKKVYPSGEIANDTTATRHNGQINSVRAEGALFGTFETGEWNAKLYFYDSDRGIPGAIVNNVFQRSERQWDRSFFAQGSFQKLVGDKYRLKVNGKYAHDYTRFLRDDPRLLPLDNSYRQQEGYVSMVQMYSIWKWWEWAVASDFQWNTLDANLRDFAYPTRFTEMISVATRLKLGTLSLQGSLLNTWVQEKVESRKQSAASPNRHIWSPALFATYTPLPKIGWSVRAFFKHCFRMPTFNDLYYTEIGNSYLKPETTRQYNVGTTYEKRFSSGWLRRVQLQGDAYYNDVKNKIIAYPKGGSQFRWTMLNLGTVRIKGVEVSPQMEMAFGQVGASLQLNYTWQQARDFTDPSEDYYKDQIPYIPLHSGSAISALTWKEWQLNYSFIYVGERYKRSANEPEFYVQPWYTSDLSVSRRLQTGTLRWLVTGEVNNLLNQQYEVVEGYPMPGINFKLIIRLMI